METFADYILDEKKDMREKMTIMCYLEKKFRNDPGKRKLDNMGKKEKADVITIEERVGFSVNRRISHKKKY